MRYIESSVLLGYIENSLLYSLVPTSLILRSCETLDFGDGTADDALEHVSNVTDRFVALLYDLRQLSLYICRERVFALLKQ